MATLKRGIIPHLWFDPEARAAAVLYPSNFKDAKIKNALTLHHTPSGSVAMVAFELFGPDGQGHQRRAAVQVQRDHFVWGQVRCAGRD